VKLKHILRLQYGSSLSADVRQEGSILVYGSNGAVGFHDKSNMLAPAIVVGRKGSHGKVVWAENGGFCIDTAFFVDHRSSFTNLRFAYYLLQTLGLDEPSKDSAVPGLDRSEAYNKYVPRLSLETQKAIADFLDRETARIDQLIEKKDRQYLALEEDQQAFITMAVTTGLDPAPMSPTANTWLKEIPAHWDLSRLKFVCARIVDCLHETPEHSERGDYPSIRTPDLIRGRLLLAQAKRGRAFSTIAAKRMRFGC
jgi:type I restriction enzyme S subunit